MISVKLDGVKRLRETVRNLDKQNRFATSLALNRTAKRIQGDEHSEIARVFTQPTPRTRSAIFVKPSTREHLEAIVGAKDRMAGIAPAKYLFPQVAGGRRRQKAFEKRLQRAGHLPAGWHVVPGEAAKKDGYGNLSRRQIIDVLAALESRGSYNVDRKKGHRARARKNRDVYWVGRPGNKAPLGVWMLDDSGRGRVRPIMIFVSHTQYRRIYGFARIAEQGMARYYRHEYLRALEHALATAR